MSYRIYAHTLDVSTYPRYARRPFQVPSWATFDHTPQFTCLRGFTLREGHLTDIQQTLDLYTVEHRLGRLVWPHFYILKADNLDELVAEIKRRDLYLFDIWAYVPMMVPSEQVPFGHLTPSGEQLELFRRELGERFLGIDNGEQDGRYVGGFARQMCPAPLESGAHYWNFHRHFRRMCDELGNQTSVLVSLTAGHYFAKEDNVTLLGAETAQALPNSQLYYSFLRGAGKQYGVHWFGNASCFNRWGWKTYEVQAESDDGNADHSFGPTKGTSLSLLKRLLYSHYLYDAVAIGFELGWLARQAAQPLPGGSAAVPGAESAQTWQLTPIGMIQQDAVRLVSERGRAGVHLAPLAVLLDFQSGWVPARQLYTHRAYQAWGNLPYGPGDYLTHGVFSLLYPGYEDASYYHDERGFASPTPYGDIADTLLSDVSAWTLAQYSTVLVAGELQGAVKELADNLRRYAEAGGRVILTAANAQRLGAGLVGFEVSASRQRFEAGSLVRIGRRDVMEPDAFELQAAHPGPGDKVLASCQRRPAAIRHPLGQGEVITLLVPFGLNADRLVHGPVAIEVDAPLPQPYRLCRHVQALLDRYLAEIAPFSAGDGLACVAARRAPGEYHVLVSNNAPQERPFAIRSQLGAVTRCVQVPLGRSVANEPGYRPEGYEHVDLGADSAHTIAGWNVRLFEVQVVERDLVELPQVAPPPAPRGRGLALDGSLPLEKAILLRPTFEQHFDTVLVPWRYLWERETAVLADEASWLRRRGIRRIVDFSGGLNLYPDLAVLDHVAEQWSCIHAQFLNVFDKMQATGCHDAILTLNRRVEASLSPAETAEGLLRVVGQLSDEAAERGITLHLANHPYRWAPSANELLSFIDQVGRPNLKYALHAGHLLADAEERGQEIDLGQVLADAGARCELVLFSAPYLDASGLVYDAHRPAATSPYAAELAALARMATNRVLLLDAVYADQDAEYTDVAALLE